jgi:predicted acyltransferase
MIIVNTPGSWSYVYAPLKHAEWHGWTPTDLVFPFFLFISGVSFSISLSRQSSRSTKQLMIKIWKRVALIFLVGLLLNWFPFYQKHISDLRIFGVLQRIALAYGIGASLILLARRNLLIILSVIILIGYHFLLLTGGDDPFSLENNLTITIDKWLIGENHMYKGFGIPFDPEGFIHSFPAAINVVIGYLIGKYTILEKRFTTLQKSGIGIVLIAVAYLWDFIGFPINKPLWTSSYVLLTCGLGVLLLMLLQYVIDDQGWKKWAFPFRIFGMNPLFSYVLSILFVKIFLMIKIGETSLYGWLYKTIFSPLLGDYGGSFGYAICFAGLVWIFSLILYRRNILIKL